MTPELSSSPRAVFNSHQGKDDEKIATGRAGSN